MNISRSILVVWLVGVACFAVGDETPAATLRIRVQNPDGTAAANTAIHAVSLERNFSFNDIFATTNDQGEAVVAFERSEKPLQAPHVGYAMIRFLVMSSDNPPVLSDTFVWNEPRERAPGESPDTPLQAKGGFALPDWYLQARAEDTTPTPVSNHDVGQLVAVKATDALEWNVTLEAPRQTAVHFVDHLGEPMANVSMRYYIDLHKNSHTGFGGELPDSKVTTDANGTLTVANMGRFFYVFEAQSGHYYAPNERSWRNEVEAMGGADDVTVTFQRDIGRDVTFQVVDSKTEKPLEGVNVGVLIDYPATIQGGAIGVTNADGVWHANGCSELACITEAKKTSHFLHREHVQSLSFTKDGYVTKEILGSTIADGQTITIALTTEEQNSASYPTLTIAAHTRLRYEGVFAPVYEIAVQRGSPVVRKISDYANLPIVITFVDRQGPALERSAKYGAYRYLITPVDSPWVMSPLYVWNETAEESGKAFEGSKEMGVGGFPLYEEYAMQMGPGGNHTNRSLGQVYKISRNVHRTWDVTMPDSSEVTLLFVEDDGVPIVNQKVQIAVRFGYDWPNESLPEDFDVGEFTTDAQGYCVFRNPGAFSYSFRRAGDTQSSQWVDTQLFPKDGRFSVYLRGRTSK